MKTFAIYIPGLTEETYVEGFDIYDAAETFCEESDACMNIKWGNQDYEMQVRETSSQEVHTLKLRVYVKHEFNVTDWKK